MAIITYYNILGIQEYASFDEIQKAYRKKAFEYHPDRNNAPNSNEIFLKVQKAYEILSDPELKIKYDHDLNIYRQKIYKEIQKRNIEKEICKTREGFPSAQQKDNDFQRKHFSNQHINYQKHREKEAKEDIKKYWYSIGVIIFLLITCSIYITKSHPRKEASLTEQLKSQKENIKKTIPPSPYFGNQLNDGESPYSKHFGSNVYNKKYNAYVNVSNGTNQDAVVIFQNVKTKRVVRNTYIRSHSSYKIKNLPEGVFEMKCMYGNDWNPKLQKDDILGGFERNTNYSAPVSSKNYLNMNIEKSKDGISIPYYEVTLHPVQNGNMKTKHIDGSEFFNQ